MGLLFEGNGFVKSRCKLSHPTRRPLQPAAPSRSLTRETALSVMLITTRTEALLNVRISEPFASAKMMEGMMVIMVMKTVLGSARRPSMPPTQVVAVEFG